MLGSLIGAGASLLGGLFSSNSAKKAAAANAAMQKQFAQEGIQWKVEDAKKAGIHPLYALGANTTSFSPSYVGDTSFGTGIANAGQDLSRAINATRSAPARDEAYLKTAQDLQLANAALQNEQLAIQNAKLRASPNPPMPSATDSYLVPGQTQSGIAAPSPKQQIDLAKRWFANPYVSNAQDVEQRHGELADAAWGAVTIPADVAYNLYKFVDPKNLPRDIMRWYNRKR